MATSKEFLNYLLEQLKDLSDVTYRPMMGEYVIYYRGKVVGDMCDNKLFVKPVSSAVNYVREAVYAPPYQGAKDMLLIEDLDDGEYLCGLFKAMYDELPEPKKRKGK